MDLRYMILSCLPSADVALNLVERYYKHVSWIVDPIPREQLMARVYDRILYSNRFGDISDVPFDHVAIFFIILALSVLADVDQPFNYQTSEPYYVLSLASFSMEPRLAAPTLAAIQSLQLTVMYSCTSEKSTADERWQTMGTVVRMTQSAGLYRDLSNWIKYDEVEIERRRKLFWEIFVYDTWTSFIMGRPAMMAHNKGIQTKLPLDLQVTFNRFGEPEPGFHHWKFLFARDCVAPILDEILGAEPPTYQTIMRLDATVRRFSVPSKLQLLPLESDFKPSPAIDVVDVTLEMQKYFILWFKETSDFFAHALSINPENPLQNKYAPPFNRLGLGHGDTLVPASSALVSLRPLCWEVLRSAVPRVN
ncbi:hypothetical protein K439DRAFT_91293 [Ramaria rubella]|nr:hypothetical protein K439DRAFT_91293 [Ramaria rubella]